MLKQNAPAAASHPSASEELERPNTRVRRLSAARGPRSRQEAKVQRVLDASLRLNQLRSSAKMHALLVEEVAKLLGAQRVLLVLESDVRRTHRRIPGPRGGTSRRTVAGHRALAR